jgi:hypothetical protein
VFHYMGEQPKRFLTLNGLEFSLSKWSFGFVFSLKNFIVFTLFLFSLYQLGLESMVSLETLSEFIDLYIHTLLCNICIPN